MFSKLLHLAKSNSTRRQPIESLTDLSFLGFDIHSHLIPGIDDGAKSVEESILLVQEMQKLGYAGLVTTPHIRADHYPNTRETISKGLLELQDGMKAAGINFPIRAAAEYYVDSNFVEMLGNEPLLTIQDNHVLIEFSFVFEPVKVFDIIFKIQTSGYIPILAHAERYTFYHSDMERLKKLKDHGCLLQLNLISLSGYYSSKVKSVAETLVKNKLYDYAGSDVHHIKHVESLKKVIKSGALDQLYDYPFLNSKVVV